MELAELNSQNETRKHISRVNELIKLVIIALLDRSVKHDRTKLQVPEAPVFAELTARLAGLTYGSKEYADCLVEMKPALDHHYKFNRHHPEFYKEGIDGMSLIDIIEMVCDWKAATERHADGDIYKSIDINTKRFNISPQLVNIIHSTVNDLGFI